MSSSTLYRLSGLALLIALPIQIVGWLMHPALAIRYLRFGNSGNGLSRTQNLFYLLSLSPIRGSRCSSSDCGLLYRPCVDRPGVQPPRLWSRIYSER
jgi:hypothetical protein